MAGAMTTSIEANAASTSEPLLCELVELRERVAAEADELLALWRPALRRRAFLPSAVNLAHYVALRRRDLRGMQEALMPLGLSSVGRCEARVLANLDAVIASLASVVGDADAPGGIRRPRPAAFYRGNRFLRRHSEASTAPTRRPMNGWRWSRTRDALRRQRGADAAS
jgi:pyruvate kinase